MQHDCLVYTSGARARDEWGFLHDGTPTAPIRVPSRIQINDGMALVAAACAGGGVLIIDRLLAAQELAQGSLVEIMPDYPVRSGQPVYAVYPARPWLAFKTATFIAFLQERLVV